MMAAARSTALDGVMVCVLGVAEGDYKPLANRFASHCLMII